MRVLAASFNSMTESLQYTLGELSRRSALAAVGEFAASMAHEVRNALAHSEARLRCPDVGAFFIDVLGDADALEVLRVGLSTRGQQDY